MNTPPVLDHRRRNPGRSTFPDHDIATCDILRQLARCPDANEAADLRAKAVDLNYALACGVARRYAGRGIDRDDLQQVALLALVLAIQRFDPDAGHTFASYAVPTIAGEIKRHFRDHGWMVRPPRGLAEIYREIQIAVDELEQSGVRAPEVTAVAERLDLSADQVRAALGVAGCFSPTSLDVPLRDRPNGTLADRFPSVVADDTEALTAQIALRQLVEVLPPGDRRLLWLRFEMDLTQREIAAQLGISQMQVSRLLTSILNGLRSRFERDVTSIAS